MEVIVEATQVVEFLEGEKKEQWFLNIRINESPLWSLSNTDAEVPSLEVLILGFRRNSGHVYTLKKFLRNFHAQQNLRTNGVERIVRF